MTIKKKLTLLLSVIFLFSFLNLGVVYLLEGKNTQASDAVAHTNKVLSTTQDLMISLLDVETGERGFLVTKNKLYLAPYFRAVKQVNEHLVLLESSVTTGVGMGQEKLLENLRTTINRKLEITKQSVDLGQSNPKQALILINGNEAKDLMDDIRTYLTRLSTQETLILEGHKADYREANAYINTIMIVEFLVLVFFAIATFSVVNKSLFDPLIKLVNATKKIESGERQVISDYLPKDEIGYLMSSFYEMSEVIIDRHEQLEEKANTDELTKVNNRLGLYKDIELTIAESNVENASLVLC
ncbi:MAG: CHASE3 domain-containing protein, partial [Vibrio litoralis]|uniref:CHASE3 domain-containing protein n=1 Tax=Vibrio litoralis TaxID=335972 RepID=UPI003F9C242E